jgi:putative membrane protein
MKSLFAIAVLASALNLSPAPQVHTNTNHAVSDANFVMEATDGGRVEVELGKLAQQKAKSPAVKAFGERMVADHGKANDQLTAIAARVGIEPTKRVGKKHDGTLKSLDSLSGANFDAAYAKLMVAGHQNTISLFEQQAKKGQAAELKAFAEKSLPLLREHLKMARNLLGPGK